MEDSLLKVIRFIELIQNKKTQNVNAFELNYVIKYIKQQDSQGY